MLCSRIAFSTGTPAICSTPISSITRSSAPRETPDIDVIVLENYQGQSATDAYGIAEPSNIATAPAVANAVYNAIGVRLRQLPMTPAAVLSALGRIPRGS